MGAYVLLIVFLRQKGLAESKKLQGTEPVNAEPRNSENAVWPIRMGGIWHWLYKNSLSLGFILLLLMSFALHAYGVAHQTSEEHAQHAEPGITTMEYVTTSKFWLESFQNWQSEFLAVFAIVVLSIFLRQHGSLESKSVNTSNTMTGTE